jgi:aryl-alcohol dehydrogenase-like predicted oxidoreductase
MRCRPLGRGGPRISATGPGRGSRPIRVGDPLEREYSATHRRASGRGFDFFDTAA